MKHRSRGHRPGGRNEPRRERKTSEANRVFGAHVVEAWLTANPQRLQTLYFDARAGEPAARLVALARAAGIPVQSAEADEIAERAGHKRHQGLVADCAPFPYFEIEDVLAREPRLVVVADRIQDPHNLGAILRTAEAVGAGALITPKDHCVAVTAVAEAASAGTSAWLPVVRATNLSRALTQLKEAGLWVVGLGADADLDIFTFNAPDRVALLVGGESGVRPLVEKQVDFRVSIPMRGRAESLNASVAAAIGMYAIAGRWGDDG